MASSDQESFGRNSMRTLIYKRTHSGDPDPVEGVFGNHDCMGSVKGWEYDAVIGIGGIGSEPKRHQIAGKLTWIGIGPHKLFNNPNKPNNPRVTFDHYWYRGERGPLLAAEYPAVAKRMYEKNVRVLIHKSGDESSGSIELDREVARILRLAKRSKASCGSRNVKSESSKCISRRIARSGGSRRVPRLTVSAGCGSTV
jgi:hypothetical protein